MARFVPILLCCLVAPFAVFGLPQLQEREELVVGTFEEQKNTQVGLGAAFNLATANVFSSLGLAAFVTG